jgi:hypothetical protein
MEEKLALSFKVEKGQQIYLHTRKTGLIWWRFDKEMITSEVVKTYEEWWQLRDYISEHMVQALVRKELKKQYGEDIGRIRFLSCPDITVATEEVFVPDSKEPPLYIRENGVLKVRTDGGEYIDYED